MIEILIALAITALITMALGTLGARLLRSRTAVTGLAANQESINMLITPLLIELRSMQTSNTGVFPIEAASTSSLTFYSDTNKDGQVERLRYFLESDTLKRGVVVPSGNPPAYNLASELINNVIANLTPQGIGIFTYFGDATDIDGAALVWPLTLSTIKVIKINLVVNQNPGQVPGALYFTTSVAPRNLRNN